MLRQDQKQELRKWHDYHCSSREIDGKPISDDGQVFDMPTYPELINRYIAEIKALGFTEVWRVPPEQATCILRIFSTHHQPYSDLGSDLTYNIYGALCYVKHHNKWVTDWGDGHVRIKFDRYETRRWLCQDEYIDFKHDFVDIYLAVR